MYYLFKHEWKRAVRSRSMIMALLIGNSITISHLIQFVIPAARRMYENIGNYQAMQRPLSSFYVWIGGQMHPMQSFLYYMAMPILASIPFGASYFEDRKSGYMKSVCIRIDKKSYLLVKYIVTFLIGGMTVIIPLLLNLGITAMLFPSLVPQPAAFLTGVSPLCIGYRLFFSYPWLYILMFMVLDFIFAGFTAVISLAVTAFVEYRFLVVMAPFIIYFFVYSLMNLFGITDYSPVYFLNPGSEKSFASEFIISYVILSILTFGIYYVRGVKEDVY